MGGYAFRILNPNPGVEMSRRAAENPEKQGKIGLVLPAVSPLQLSNCPTTLSAWIIPEGSNKFGNAIP